MCGTLYVVATPIGNLADLSPRAAEILGEADLIAAEDTRNTRVLLDRFSIRTQLVSNHKFNEPQSADRLLALLLEGKSVAIVSDAGTPCISDPGAVLVKAAAESGIPVVGIGGCCAAVIAVSVSGFDAADFTFSGFLPRTAKDRSELLERWLRSNVNLLVVYESPKRIKPALEWLGAQFPAMKICLCNDLTKKFERIYRGTPEEILAALAENPAAEKGEYTAVLERPQTEIPGDDEPKILAEALLLDFTLRTGCTLREAVTQLAADGARPKKELYAASVRLKEMLREEAPGKLK